VAENIETNIWTTKSINKCIEDLNKTGVLPKNNPFFQRNVKLLKEITYEYTHSELLEIMACKNDILHFASICKIRQGKHGMKTVTLRPYQKVALKLMAHNQFFIWLASRQIGKSIVTSIFLAWLILFHSNMNVLVGSENLLKAKQLKAKLDEIMSSLPYHLQCGVMYHSTQRTILDNGSSLSSEPTTENFGVSGSYSTVYIDEFALIEPDLQQSIIEHVFPTMDSFGDDARFLITSTPRGRNNTFAKLFFDSLEDLNGFVNLTTKWFEVDRPDQLKWKAKQVAIMGDIGFSQEYDLSFDSDATLLFDSDAQKAMLKDKAEYMSYDGMSEEILTNYVLPTKDENITERLKGSDTESNIKEDITTEEIFKNMIIVKEGYDIKNLCDPNRFFVMSIDLAEGKGLDYSVNDIFEIEPKSIKEIKNQKIVIDESSFFRLRQVAIIRSNKLEIEDFAKFNFHFITGTGNHENFKMVLETNFSGGLFMKTFFEVGGMDNNILDPSEMVVEFPYNMVFEDAITFKFGITQTNKTKTSGCKLIKKYVSNTTIVMTEEKTIVEAQGFGKDKKGNYKGTTRNDDNFLTVLNASHFIRSESFMEQVEDLMSVLDPEITEAIQNAINKYEDGDLEYSFKDI
jgi:hypothetical protein